MDDMRISGQYAAAWRSYSAQQAASQPSREQSSRLSSGYPASPSRRETPSIAEMMQQAREKAAEARERFRLPKNSARYGDSAMIAYARLAQAKNKSQVCSATGYARRQIVQLKAAMRRDPENADRIRAAINQLQKAVSRGNRKKRDLEQEKLMDYRRARAQREDNQRKARHLKHELHRRQAMRAIREHGYLREADIDNKFQDQLSATRMELRAQAQSLAAAIAPSTQAAVQQYSAQAAPSAAPAPETGGGIDVQA